MYPPASCPPPPPLTALTTCPSSTAGQVHSAELLTHPSESINVGRVPLMAVSRLSLTMALKMP
jgi:hypothetical protein